MSTVVAPALFQLPSGAAPMAVHWCHSCIASLAFCRRHSACPLLPPLYIVSLTFWRRPYGRPLVSLLHRFTCLLSPPQCVSTVATPEYSYTDLLAPPLWLSTGVTLALLHLPSVAAPTAVHCNGPCIASAAFWRRPCDCPLLPPL
jgi:hypothetical protein